MIKANNGQSTKPHFIDSVLSSFRVSFVKTNYFNLSVRRTLNENEQIELSC